MAKAVLFDLDGVLVDTYDLWFHLINTVARRLGCPPVPAEVYRPTFGQGLEADIDRFYPGFTVDQIRAQYDLYYDAHLVHLKAIEGAAAALRSIALPKAVITNSPTGAARLALRKVNLEGYFQTVVGSDQVAASKPAPDEVFEACRRLGVTPAEALVVGDSRFDEGAAKAAGAPFVWFRSFAELKI